MPSRKTRVLFTLLDAGAFGAETGVLNTLSSLDRESFEPQALVFSEGPFIESARALGVPVTYLPGMLGATLRRPWSLIPAAFRLARYIERCGVDVVELCWGLQHLPLLVLATKLARRPLVYRERMHSGKLRLAHRWSLSQTAAIVPVSRGAIEAWDDWRWCRPWRRVLEQRVRVVPSGRDIARFRAATRDRELLRPWEVPRDAPVVGMVAAMVERKRHDLLLRAAPAILHACPDAWFLLVGGPYSHNVEESEAYVRRLRALAAELGLGQRAVFTGYWKDAASLIKNLDVIVLPSEREALGSVLIEAQAMGVPPVASDVDGVREVVAHEKTGFLIAGDRPDEYARAVVRLLTEEGLRERMGRAGEEHARSFDNSRLTRMLEDCYRRAAAREAQPATECIRIPLATSDPSASSCAP